MRYAKERIRGLGAGDEIGTQQRRRDHRTFAERLAGALDSRPAGLTIFFGSAALFLLLPATLFILFPLVAFYARWRLSIRYRLPYNLPLGAGQTDWSTTDLADRPGKAAGIAFVGNDRETGEEIWISDANLRAHGGVLGTTGSGKTEFLLSLVANALAWASGYLYSDGKGDAALWGKSYSLARRFGRDDDLLLLSYLIGRSGGNSNSLNFFAEGAADVLTNTFTTLLSDLSGSGTDMWKERAVSLGATAITVATELRDKGLILFNVNTLRQFTSIETLLDLYFERPLSCGIPGTPGHLGLSSYRLSAKTRAMLNAFIESVPGFDAAKAKARQPMGEDFNKQVNFLAMQMTKVLGTLCDVYDYIFAVPLGEIDMEDVVVNRRILIIMLPSLEKSPDETANLGKIIISALKSMMGNGLMSKAGLEGEAREVLENRPTNSATPYPAVLDEIGYYFVKGLGPQFAQGRALGFSLWPGGQDVAAMKQNKSVENEVDAALANINFLAFGKITDTNQTADLFRRTVDQASVATVDTLRRDRSGLTGTYSGAPEATIGRMERGSFLDLKEQKAGQFHFTFGSSIVRANVFHANPPIAGTFARNRFLMVRDPAGLKEEERQAAIDGLAARLNDPLFTLRPRPGEEAPDQVAAGRAGRGLTVCLDALEAAQGLTGDQAICAAIHAVRRTMAAPSAVPEGADDPAFAAFLAGEGGQAIAAAGLGGGLAG